MTTQENKFVVQRYFEALNAGQLDALYDTLVAPDYRLHMDSLPVLDRAGTRGAFSAFLRAFPDLHHSIESQIAEGDMVATCIVVRGTHTGDFQGIPPTGRSIAVAAINMHHLVNGKVVEQWISSDTLSLLQQLGVIPTAEHAA
jgi:steroid delta-isomerase-like uncharacterized protein